MTNSPLNDPELRELEAKLLAIAPQAAPPMSASRRTQLLYDCAFAAGRRKAKGALWRWRAAAGALALALMVFAFPSGSEPDVAQSPPKRTAPVERSDPFTALLETLAPRQEPVSDLDAWRVEAKLAETLDEQLSQLSRANAHERSLAVGAMTRAALTP